MPESLDPAKRGPSRETPVQGKVGPQTKAGPATNQGCWGLPLSDKGEEATKGPSQGLIIMVGCRAQRGEVEREGRFAPWFCRPALVAWTTTVPEGASRRPRWRRFRDVAPLVLAGARGAIQAKEVSPLRSFAAVLNVARGSDRRRSAKLRYSWVVRGRGRAAKRHWPQAALGAPRAKDAVARGQWKERLDPEGTRAGPRRALA